jgi:hypothetical protein
MMGPMRAPGAVLVLAALASAPAAWARGYESLGALEREAVDEALLARGLHVEPAPEGKTIGAIHVVNHEVFSRRDSYLQLLNVFHRTTREWIIRREVLLQPGAHYDEALAEETTRNLRNEDFTSLVAVLPVKASEPGKVDLLVVTRDVWSLRFNTDYEYQEGTLVFLTTSLSENNLFGWRKMASLAFNIYQGSYSLGPTYVDPNVAGTRLTFSTSYRLFYSRATGEREGSSLGGRIDYPLYALSRKWGAGLGLSRSEGISRTYLRNRLATIDFADTPQDEALPRAYHYRQGGVDASVVRSFGVNVIQRVSAGYSLAVLRPSLVPGFSLDQPPALPREPLVRPAASGAGFGAEQTPTGLSDGDLSILGRYRRALLPPSERSSAVYLSYGLFTPRYRIYRDYDTYDLREDVRLGPSASASASRAASWLGSEVEYVGLGASAGWAFDWKDGYQRLSVGWGARVRGGRLVDESRSVGLTLASPVLARAVRLVAAGGGSVLINNTRNSYYSVGGQSGLRGYALGDFIGQAQYVAHGEVRSRALPVGALRIGALTFYDVGHAAPSIATLRAYQDVGLGVRILIPQLNFYVLRFDWAFALQSSRHTRAGWPPRFSAGFRQVF